MKLGLWQVIFQAKDNRRSLSHIQTVKGVFLYIFSAMGRPFEEWKIPKQENKDTACESSRLYKESSSRRGKE